MAKFAATVSIIFEAPGPNSAYEKLKSKLESIEDIEFEIEDDPEEVENEEDEEDDEEEK